MPEPLSVRPTRRGVLRGLALGGLGGLTLPALSGCAGGSDEPQVPAGKPGEKLAQAADVPVGGGEILGDQKIVVTHPSDGEFRAFSAVCTHQSCILSTVANNTITCACHGSQFSAQDGSNVTGPGGSEAGSVPPLPAVAIKVKNGTIVRG